MKKFLSFILAFAMLIMLLPVMASAADQVYHNSTSEIFYDGWSTFQCTANGNQSFCLEPEKGNRPDGNYDINRVLRPGTGYDLLIKCAFYLYGGPGWAGFRGTFSGIFWKFSDTSKQYGYSHAIMAYVWSGSTKGLSADTVSILPDVLAIIGAQPMPSGFDVFTYGEGSSTFQTYLGWEYTPTGKLSLRKITNKGENLAGVTFGVFTNAACTTYAKDLDGNDVRLVTGSDGTATSPDLLPGTYYVKEIDMTDAQHEVLNMNPTVYPVTVQSGDITPIAANPVVNEYKTIELQIVKEDPDPDRTYSLAEAVFEIRNITTGEKWTVTTNAQGTTSKAQIPLGIIEIEEMTAPYGFHRNPEVQTFDLRKGEKNVPVIVQKATIINHEQFGRVNIIKTGKPLTGADIIEDESGTLYIPRYEERPLPDAVFDIIALRDVVAWDGRVLVKAGTVVDTVTTDADGQAESKDLHLGDYYAVERIAPEGMVLDPTPHNFSLVYGDQNKPVVFEQIGVFDKRQKAEVSLGKFCEWPKKPPAGYDPFAEIVFGLFAREEIISFDGVGVIPKDGLLERITFDSGGNPTVDTIVETILKTDIPFGKYYIKELETGALLYLDDAEYDFEFVYDVQDEAVVKLPKEAKVFENWVPGWLTIHKSITPELDSEHATGAGVKMSELGFTKGQQWEEYTPVTVGGVKNGTFRADIVCEMEHFKVGDMTAKFAENGDLEIWYECLYGSHLQQGARLDIVDDPTKFKSKDRADLPFRSDTDNYSGATSGKITVPAAKLAELGIDVNDDDQTFYVFLRLDKVAGGIYSDENRSWIDSGYEYEFMIFDLFDFEGKGYANQKAIEQAVKTDVNGILAKGIRPVKTVFCQAGASITVELPAGKLREAGKYLVAEVFKDSNGNIINNPKFVNIIGIDGVFTANKLSETKVNVKNGFNIFFTDNLPNSTPIEGSVTVTGLVRSQNPSMPATVQLLRDGVEQYKTDTETSTGSGPAEQSFTFTGVAPGEYTMIITKPGHASYTVQAVTIGDADVNLTPTPRDAAGAITLPCGDITGDNMINDGDLAVLWLAANYNKSAADPTANELCDLNGDGMINDGDLAILWLAANYNKGAVVVS